MTEQNRQMTRQEQEQMRRLRARKAARMRRLRRRRRILVGCVLLILLLIAGLVALTIFVVKGRKGVDLSAVQTPDWIIQEFLDPNEYSRPQTPLKKVNGIVVHYTANPGKSAEANRSYFNGLAVQNTETKTYASSHFIIGLSGEIIQCIPLDEWAYTSKERNKDTISIECCHPDSTGKFNDATYRSLVKLTAWLCEELGVKNEDIIRHYDVGGKKCPLYFVEHEDEWKKFKKDVKAYKKENY